MRAVLDKKILTDEEERPVAVQIAYEDWLEIERRLGLADSARESNLEQHAGRISLPVDPDEFQEDMRGEWA